MQRHKKKGAKHPHLKQTDDSVASSYTLSRFLHGDTSSRKAHREKAGVTSFFVPCLSSRAFCMTWTILVLQQADLGYHSLSGSLRLFAPRLPAPQQHLNQNGCCYIWHTTHTTDKEHFQHLDLILLATLEFYCL